LLNSRFCSLPNPGALSLPRLGVLSLLRLVAGLMVRRTLPLPRLGVLPLLRLAILPASWCAACFICLASVFSKPRKAVNYSSLTLLMAAASGRVAGVHEAPAFKVDEGGLFLVAGAPYGGRKRPCGCSDLGGVALHPVTPWASVSYRKRPCHNREE